MDTWTAVIPCPGDLGGLYKLALSNTKEDCSWWVLLNLPKFAICAPQKHSCHAMAVYITGTDECYDYHPHLSWVVAQSQTEVVTLLQMKALTLLQMKVVTLYQLTSRDCQNHPCLWVQRVGWGLQRYRHTDRHCDTDTQTDAVTQTHRQTL